MADGDSGNYDWVLPEVGASDDSWGTKNNNNWAGADAAVSALAAKHIDGLTLSAAGGSGSFGIAAGVAGDASGAMMVLASAFSKTTGGWASGSGNGALDGGSIANSTWYHVFLIKNPTTLSVDILISTNLASPTMPSGYTLKRRIGSIKTNGAAQWLKFTQYGDEFLWSVPVQDYQSGLSAGAITVPLPSLPPGLNVKAKIRGLIYSTTPDLHVLIASLAETNTVDTPAGNRNVGGTNSVENIDYELEVWTNTNQEVKVSSTGAISAFYAVTAGWVDPRGKI